jgi:hypothetical protein
MLACIAGEARGVMVAATRRKKLPRAETEAAVGR